VCRALAEQGYVEELGARSIFNTIDREIKTPLVNGYLGSMEEEDIRADGEAAAFVVSVDKGLGEVKVSQCAVERGTLMRLNLRYLT
jgi:ATP-dependent Clp protease ATP-binding subunit ClpA